MRDFAQQLFVVLIILLLAGCAPGFKRSPETVTREEQLGFAETLRPALVQRLGGLCNDPALLASLNQAFSRLAIPEAPAVLVTNDDTPHLIALTDGSLIISRGALFPVDNADSLAALLAHALGHVRQQHPLQALLRLTAGGPPPDDSPVASWAAITASALLDTDFSEDDEQAADATALELLAAAGIAPEVLLHLVMPDTAAESHLQRHPRSAARLAAVTRTADGLKLTASVAIDAAVFASARAALDAVQPAYQLYRQARQAEKAGAIDQALTLYLQAAERSPEESLLLTGLGMAYLRQDALVAARQHLSRAVHIDGNYYYSQLGLGYIALLQQDTDRSVRHLQRSLKLLPTARGGFLLAEAYVARGETDAAIDLYRAVAVADADGFSRTARTRLQSLGVAP